MTFCRKKAGAVEVGDRISAEWVVLVALVGLFARPRGGFCESPRAEIAEIRIVCENVFDTNLPGYDGWAYRLVDSLHVTTSESFVRQLLPLVPGQNVSAEEISEAERVLRTFSFLRSAEVRRVPREDSRIDIEVRTRDAWTTKVGASFGGVSGATHYGFGAEEVNFLGFGKTIEVSFQKNPERTTKSLLFFDPRLLGTNHVVELEYRDGTDGRGFRGRGERPLRLGADPWGWSIEGEDLRQTVSIYRHGETSSTISEHIRRFGAELLGTARGSAVETLRLGVGLVRLRDDFEPLDLARPDDRPADRDRADLYGILRFQQLRFHSGAYINRFSRVEDIPIGFDLELRGGLSPKAFAGSENVLLTSGHISKGFEVEERSFGLFKAEWDYRHGTEGRERSGRLIVDGTLFYRGTSWPERNLLVFHLRYGMGSGLAPQDRFLLGGDNGLRGYLSHFYDGDRTALLNIEHRFSGETEFLNLVQIGAAAFFDAGVAADHRAWNPGSWRSSIGVGLRAAVPRSTHVNVIRLDVSYPFSDDLQAKRGIVISFGSGQAF
jgi:hypothetical protein